MEHLRVDPKYRRRPRPKRAGWAARETYLLLLQISAEFDLRGRLSPSYQDVDFLAEEWVNGDDERLELARQVITEGLPAAIESGLLIRDGEDLVIVDWDKWYSPPKSGAERTKAWRERKDETVVTPPPVANPPPSASSRVTDVTPVTDVTATVTSDATPHHSTPLKETHTSAAPTSERPAEPPKAPDLELELPPTPVRLVKPDAATLQRLWNELAAPGLPRWREMSSKRRKAAEARLRERSLDGPGGWREVIERINASAFLRGSGRDGWRASPDWILQPDSAAKVLEGKYDPPGEIAHGVPAGVAPLRRYQPGEDLYGEGA